MSTPRIYEGSLASALLCILLGFFAFGFLSLLFPEDAQARNNRVDFTLTVSPIEDQEQDPDLRVRRHREVTKEAARRIETRLDAIDVKNSRVRVDDDYNIEITVYGDHSASAIKSALIPTGKLEIRPVLDDVSPWADLADELPDDVEIRTFPGSFRTDRIFLFSHSLQSLRSFVDRVAIGSTIVELFPHDDGWRSLNLGEPIATEDHLSSATIEKTPAGIPFVTVGFDTTAAQQIRSHTSSSGATHLAILLDGEVVSLHRFVARRFSDRLDLEPPDHLRSRHARSQWAIQVAGRLAAPIPVQLVEIQE